MPVRVHTVLGLKMCSNHTSSTTSMATATTKKTRHLLKKEVMFTSRRLQLKTWFGRNGSVRREGDGSSGIARSVLSREVSAVLVYMLRRWLRWKTSVWLTRTLSYCLLVLQPPPGSLAPDKLEVSHACNHLWCCLRNNILADQAAL